ncbi:MULTISPECIES: hypothetical protein [Aerosakkonema]|uniref:hypothetical protein n=1 Tax=Aerosakkonema TaxID=1246629 RepID=UPI0035BC1F29
MRSYIRRFRIVNEILGNPPLTQWHPAFLALGKSLDECAKKYRGFCQRYKPQPKAKKPAAWGSKMLPLPKIRSRKSSSGQLPMPEIRSWRDNIIEEVAHQFIAANRFNVVGI